MTTPIDDPAPAAVPLHYVDMFNDMGRLPIVMHRQPDGEIAEVLRYMQEEVTKACGVSTHMLGDPAITTARQAFERQAQQAASAFAAYGKPGGPLAAIRAWQERTSDAVAALNIQLRINLPAGQWKRARHRIARAGMSKRAFRRWRGKRRARR
jgi:hypothetical protein